MSDPHTVIMVHFWGKHIGSDASKIADEAIAALTNAGYIIQRRVEVVPDPPDFELPWI